MNWRAEWNDYDEVVARSIFGVDTADAVEALIGAWAGKEAGAAARIVDLQMSAGAAAALELADRRRVFLKAWPSHRDPAGLAAQMRVQAAMAADGYPAPKVLGDLKPLGAASAVLMEFDRGGEPTDVRSPGVPRAMARGLAEFVRRAARFALDPDLPPAAWPMEGAVWPRPHTAGFDFEAAGAGAEWIDEFAVRAQAVMRRAKGPPIPSHHDWSAKNMRMKGQEITVLYDWDSVFLAPETVALGSAIAHFPVSWEVDAPPIPSPGEMAAFVAEYEAERGRPFDDGELAEVAAAATYSRAYVARCEHCFDPQGVSSAMSRAVLRDLGAYTADMLRA